MTTFGIVLIILGVLLWTLLIAFLSLAMGFLGVIFGVRALKPHLPLMIWQAVSTRRRELKGKSVLTLTLEVVRQSVYGMAGGRPSKGAAMEGKLGGIMSMIQQAQELVQASKAPPQA